MNNLNEVFNIIEPQRTLSVAPIVIQDSLPEEDADFEYSRNNYYELIEQGKAAINTAMQVAAETQNPRALEVLGTLIKQMSEVNKQLVQMGKDRQDVKMAKKQNGGNNTRNEMLNNINGVVIKSSDINKILRERSQKED
jgi:hypothetical protein